MAIKGKSKSRGARSVTRGPKPVYVPVKTPWFRRRWLWISVGAVLGVAAVVAIVVGVIEERNRNRDEEELRSMAAAASQYRGEIEPILSTVGHTVPPTSFDAFPALGSSLTDLGEPQPREAALERARTAAEDTATAAEDARGLFEQIDGADIAGGRGLSREFVDFFVDSQTLFVQSMAAYDQAALLTTMALDAENEAREGLLARATGVHEVAEALFARAYQDYVEAMIAAEIFSPTTRGTFPTPTGPTG
jgi:hypothetical protein